MSRENVKRSERAHTKQINGSNFLTQNQREGQTEGIQCIE